jgi:hypothetical protein
MQSHIMCLCLRSKHAQSLPESGTWLCNLESQRDRGGLDLCREHVELPVQQKLSKYIINSFHLDENTAHTIPIEGCTFSTVH